MSHLHIKRRFGLPGAALAAPPDCQDLFVDGISFDVPHPVEVESTASSAES